MRNIFLNSFTILLLITGKVISQVSQVAVVLNEYQVTNTTLSNLDNYFEQSDWVELYNAHTASVNLGGWYLSNDRYNLFKWRIPNTFTMGVGEYKIIWMSGRDEVKLQGGQYHFHTNFTIDQCKNQWIILTAPNGVVRDSVFVQKTKENHSRGRVNYTAIGVQNWRIFTTPTFSTYNGTVYYLDYLPTPKFTETQYFSNTPSPLFEIYTVAPGVPIDTSCYEVWYTTDGSFPMQNAGTAQQFIDNTTIIVPPVQTTMFRAVTYPKKSTPPAPPTYCEVTYLPSFCETTTFFHDPMEQNFDPKFGILSVAIHTTDINWFLTGVGSPTVHVEYFDNKTFKFEGYAKMSKPVNEEWLTLQKGFELNIDDRRGFGCNFEGNIFNVQELGTSTRTVFPTLCVYGGDIESHSAPITNTNNPSFGTGIRDVFVQSLAAKHNIKVNPLHIKPVYVYINGAYAGIFNLKETYDKDYEKYYLDQPRDNSSLLFYHNAEGVIATSTVTNDWKTNIYNFVTAYPMNQVNNYATLKKRLDIPNFIDWTIMNSFFQNSNLFNYNIAFAKGTNTLTNGGKWHHYLWNVPAILQFTAVSSNTLVYNTASTSPCAVQQPTYPISVNAYNGQGVIFDKLMKNNIGSPEFKQSYLTRYQDLLNGPLSCEELLNHWNNLNNLYRTAMKEHEDPGRPPFPGLFATQPDAWDTNMAVLKRAIEARCKFMKNAFNTFGCYGLQGPYPITVDVRPQGAGKVKLNTMVLQNYKWSGNYYSGLLTFKAIPADTSYVFSHWELKNYNEANLRPLTSDSIGIFFSFLGEEVVAVFTDKKLDPALPTGFTPNGDGLNDEFKILGSGRFGKEFEMRIWNRWGQELFKTNDPNIGWDGRFKGEPCPAGVYAYLITYRNFNNEPVTLKGNITLIR
ncbi:MAG: CotH kinase family protein [Bacteroidia bacterium]|nr:CotH kinase family protein [Bacteroidia bacterium]